MHRDFKKTYNNLWVDLYGRKKKRKKKRILIIATIYRQEVPNSFWEQVPFLVYMFTLLIHWFISPTEGRCIISWHVLDLPYPIIFYDPLFLEDQARTSEEFLWTKVFLKPNFLASCQSFDSANLSLTGPTTVGWLRESPIRNLPVSSLKEALVLKQLGLQEVLIQPNGWRYH